MLKCIKRDLFPKKKTSIGYRIHRFFFNLYWKYYGQNKRRQRLAEYAAKGLTNEIYEKAISLRKLKQEKEENIRQSMYDSLNEYFKDKDF